MDAQGQGDSSATPNPTPNSATTESSQKQTTEAEPSSGLRGKTDPGWEHFALKKEGKTNVYTCLHCLCSYRGGGINRMKQHLAGVTGNIASCKKVSHDVRHKMLESLNEVRQKKPDTILDEAYNGGGEVEQDVQEIETSSQSRTILGKRKCNALQSYFAPRTTPGSQPSLKSVLRGKEAHQKAKKALARWWYNSCIAFNACQTPYFQEALDAVAAVGPGFKAPNFHELRVNLLGDVKKDCELLVESQRKEWAATGCTIMADGWTDQRQRTLINFLVYCPTGLTFVKSVDASDVVKDAKNLFNLFSEVIEWVGPDNVHVVTDNAANYVAAGKLIHEKYEL